MAYQTSSMQSPEHTASLNIQNSVPVACYPFTLRRPSKGDWESLRPLITELWYNRKHKLSVVILILRRRFSLLITEKPFKQQLKAWGLLKKLNAEDVADLTVAYSELKASHREGHILLRGRVESLQHIREYKKRAKSLNISGINKSPDRALSNVIILDHHPLLRPEPSLSILQEFETLLRETQLFCHRAKSTDLYTSDLSNLSWKYATSLTYDTVKLFQFYVWESTRAFSEHNMWWAGLCWRASFMILEHLVWLPDLETWTAVIRCCVRLGKMGLSEIGIVMLKKLSWLRNMIPALAPHRPILDALVGLPYRDLVEGGLFLLQAKVKLVQRLWPDAHASHIDNQMEVAEQHSYMHISKSVVPELVTQNVHIKTMDDVWAQVQFNACQTSSCMLNKDYKMAADTLCRTVEWLKSQAEHFAHEIKFQTLSAIVWAMLGNVHYANEDFDSSYTSYMNALRFNHQCLVQHGMHALELPYIHRIWSLVSWIIREYRAVTDISEDFCFMQKQILEKFLEQTLQNWSHSKFGHSYISKEMQKTLSNTMTRCSKAPVKSTDKAAPSNDGIGHDSKVVKSTKLPSMPIREKPLRRPIFVARAPPLRKYQQWQNASEELTKTQARSSQDIGQLGERQERLISKRNKQTGVEPGVGGTNIQISIPIPIPVPVTPWD